MFGLFLWTLLAFTAKAVQIHRREDVQRPEPIKTAAPADDKIKVMWDRFRKDRQVSDTSRYDTFRHNVIRAHEKNNERGVHCEDLFDGSECVFGITKFAHMTEEEFASTMLKRKRLSPSVQNMSALRILKSTATTLESSVDWRRKGAVTRVKDQGYCGSCYAFSATEQVESAIFMATGRLDELSTEQIVSCDTRDMGCEGGLTEWALDYVVQAGGLSKAMEYPDLSSRTGVSSFCQETKVFDSTASAQKVVNWHYAVAPCLQGSCGHQNEEGMAAAMSTLGPMSICVHAYDWMLYMRGVFDLRCSSDAMELDHCVQVVGYNKESSNPYWIVRNSWDVDWGEQGYIYLAMGSNLCGVADEAIVVDVAV